MKKKKRILNLFKHDPNPTIHRREIRWIACNAAQSLLFLLCRYNCSLSSFVYIWTFRSYGSRRLPVTSRRKSRRALNRALVFGVNETTDGRRTETEWTKMGSKIAMARIMPNQVHAYAGIDSWPPLCRIDVFVPIPFSRASPFFLLLLLKVPVSSLLLDLQALSRDNNDPFESFIADAPSCHLSTVLFLVDRAYLFVFFDLRLKMLVERIPWAFATNKSSCRLKFTPSVWHSPMNCWIIYPIAMGYRYEYRYVSSI